MMTVPTFFQGELQFRRYSDSSTQGQQIVFNVADREALSGFIGMEGKRMACVLVLIGDDEQPVQAEPARKSRKDTRGPLCREACDYCAMPDFQEWVWCKGDDPKESERMAAHWLREKCGVVSRNDLDTDPLMADIFRDRIRVPFMKWQREQRA